LSFSFFLSDLAIQMDHPIHQNQTAKNRKLIAKKSEINIVSKFYVFLY